MGSKETENQVHIGLCCNLVWNATCYSIELACRLWPRVVLSNTPCVTPSEIDTQWSSKRFWGARDWWPTYLTKLEQSGRRRPRLKPDTCVTSIWCIMMNCCVPVQINFGRWWTRPILFECWSGLRGGDELPPSPERYLRSWLRSFGSYYVRNAGETPQPYAGRCESNLSSSGIGMSSLNGYYSRK